MRNSTMATVLALMVATSANAADITLKAGDYGAIGTACNEQANATIMSFDGRSFSYPHASQCVDKIVRRSAGVTTIAETCRAAGDGGATAPDTQTFQFRQQGAERFAIMKGRSVTTYKRCGTLGYFDKH